MKKHILICGHRNAGKTTLINSLMEKIKVPVYGFQTSTVQTDPDGTHHIYMYPAGKVDGRMEESNHIGDCNTVERTVNLSVFDELGAKLIDDAKPDGVLVMDEIGFMEIGSERFCDAVLGALDGDIPVLATVKDTDFGAEFLDRVRQHPGAELIMLTPENREEVKQRAEEILSALEIIS
ncbi:MAG: hypothetical protein E7240_09545 [Lachnospiraceae bacterium]|nr:hypothetical protein [Lachnospiraceae bacterium]